MMRLLVQEVGSGLHPSEAVVIIKTIKGEERLIVSKRSISKGSIQVGWPLRMDGDDLLIELPRETQAGAWRVWVNRAQLTEPELLRA
jgi:hypothetical protein